MAGLCTARVTSPVLTLAMYTTDPTGKLVVESFGTVTVILVVLLHSTTLSRSVNTNDLLDVVAFSVLKELTVPFTVKVDVLGWKVNPVFEILAPVIDPDDAVVNARKFVLLSDVSFDIDSAVVVH